MNAPQDIARARAAGQYAREAGRERSSCPRFGIHAEAAELRRAWLDGYDSARRVA